VTSKDQVLREIVEIVRAHDIGIEEISAALAEDPAAGSSGTDDEKSSILTRVLAYLGGIFVFAGLGVFIAMNWESMNFVARVVITLGSGIAAFVMALIALNDERYEKAATPLFLIAALLQPVGLLVIFEEFYGGNKWDVAGLVTSGAMALQQILTLKKTQRTTLLFTGIVFLVAFFLILFDMLDVDYDFIALVLGGSLLSLSVGLDQTRHKVITPFWYFTGSMWFLYGVFALLERSVLEILFLAVVSALVYLSTVVRSRTLLFVSTVAMLAYIGYYSAEHFVQSIGWPIALVFFGLLLIGLSAMAFRINKRYIRAGG
jgi:uncharacterized membrane protein